ncbi:cell division protein FtsQ/DivIB [Flavihumibacter petaseus]|uniref:Cell division protein FtsQ/DivIB C-terminal domain-containing protein n=1 Tax=Flavihumibacter petaseus NBRC 106054 TaxID=1220578 RepID=A0A0E9N560_9BACT|nr:cell division protein FtsQ/DivIB [Flavihumibacter petaseus]GAO44954.1 hypothetical protein FPE01S_04_01970 [Flavihumibacter petaseus NBRC 106054]
MVKPRINIRKVLLAILWMFVGAGVILVLVAAIRKSNAAHCESVNIAVVGKGPSFLLKSDIWSMMGSTGPKQFVGKPVAAIDLIALERKLNSNTWVQHAELFIDKEGVLQVRVTERKPVARIFTTLGNTFYVDSTGKYLPLGMGKPAMRLPVFTGMPDKLKLKNAEDSILLTGIKAISEKLGSDAFWGAQITQIDLGADGNFDMVPLVGRHIIHFGNGENVEDKFQRLAIFYRDVLTKTGIDYYRSVSVQFEKQIVGEKDGPISTSVDKKIGLGQSPAPPLAVSNSSTLNN